MIFKQIECCCKQQTVLVLLLETQVSQLNMMSAYHNIGVLLIETFATLQYMSNIFKRHQMFTFFFSGRPDETSYSLLFHLIFQLLQSKCRLSKNQEYLTRILLGSISMSMPKLFQKMCQGSVFQVRKSYILLQGMYVVVYPSRLKEFS